MQDYKTPHPFKNIQYTHLAATGVYLAHASAHTLHNFLSKSSPFFQNKKL